MKVFTRYLLRAHIGPFLFALVALTGIILINTLAKELANLAGKGLPFEVVAEFFFLSLPANVALTMPMAVLVAVLYTFSQLASDNEITALRSSGVDLRRAALPLVIAGAVITGGMIWFNDQVLPAANYRWRLLMTDVAQTSPLLALQSQRLNPIQSSDGVTRYYLEARQFNSESGSMDGVTIYDVSSGGITRTIVADSGQVAFNTARTDLFMTLHDGRVWEVDFNDPGAFQLVEFERQVMRMEGVGDEFQRSYGSEYRTDRDMTIAMMRVRIDSLRTEISQIQSAMSGDAPIAAAGADGAGPDSDADSLAPPAVTEEIVLSEPGFGEVTAGGEIGSDAAPVASSDAGEGATEADVLATGGGATTTSAERATGLEQELSAAAGAALEIAAEPDGSQPEQSDSAAVGSETPRVDGRTDAPPSQVSDRFSQARINSLEYQIREYRLEIQKKFTIAFATLVFVLIGVPLALRFPRGGIGMVSVFSLAIFGIYYVGLIGGEELSDRGYVPVVVAMWTTNVVFGVLGLIGFLRLGREQGSGRGSGWGDLPRWLRLPGRRRELGRSDA